MKEKRGDRSAGHTEATVDQLREYYNDRYRETRTELIEAGRVRDYLLSMDEPLPNLEEEPVPPLFLLTLGRTRRPQPARGGAVNAGDEFEFLRPVFVGDRISVSAKVGSIEEKQGRRGVMFLVRIETTYTNQDSQPVALRRGSILRWDL